VNSPTPILSGLRILVVDDEYDVRELMAYLLEESGAEVHLADEPTAALDVLATRPIDLMISDIAMPDEDGYSLMRRVRGLRDYRRHIPAIAVTAFTGTEARERAFNAGFDLHVGKTVHPSMLIAAVRDLARARTELIQ
jgi:CheY-like chemotaxis protein